MPHLQIKIPAQLPSFLRSTVRAANAVPNVSKRSLLRWKVCDRSRPGFGLAALTATAPSTNASTLVRPSWRRDSLEGILAPARKMGRGAHGRGCSHRSSWLNSWDEQGQASGFSLSYFDVSGRLVQPTPRRTQRHDVVVVP